MASYTRDMGTVTSGTFEYWCDTGTTAITTTWVDWSSESTSLEQVRYVVPTVEETNQVAIKRIEAEDRRKAAIECARELLVASLTDEQRGEYDANESFIVFGQKTGQRYRINNGRAGNVHELDRLGQVRRRYCAHPGMRVPNADTMLAQKLMLECHELDFLDKANVS